MILLLLLLPAAVRAQEVPDAGELRHCPDGRLGSEEHAVVGVVTADDSGTPLPGARVSLRTAEPGDPNAEAGVEVPADHQGVYRICGAPSEDTLIARASFNRFSSPGARFVLPDTARAVRRDLRITLSDGGAILLRARDALGRDPVSDAVFQLEDTDRTGVTDREGRLRIDRIPAGTYRYRLLHPGYAPVDDSLRVRADETHVVAVHLQREPIEVDPVSVTLEYRPHWLEETGFYHRQELGLGRYLTPAAVEARRAQQFTRLVQELPGVRTRRVCQPHCYQLLEMTSPSRLGYCPPSLYVDGQELRLQRIPDFDQISVQDVAAVEVYRGISQTPAEFAGKCGSVVVWTKRHRSDR